MKYSMKYLNADPEIMGGHLVIKGTRIPLEVLFYELSRGSSFEEIHKKWSYVDFDVLKGAITEAAELLAQKFHA